MDWQSGGGAMSAQQFSVTIKCDFCDEVISISGKEIHNTNLAILRNRMHNLGWKTTNIRIRGKLLVRDCCPVCRVEHAVS
jgi:hypothetical protein